MHLLPFVVQARSRCAVTDYDGDEAHWKGWREGTGAATAPFPAALPTGKGESRTLQFRKQYET